jgi:hypothetical protein
MTNAPAANANADQKPNQSTPASPQQTQGTPKPAEQKPNEQQK